MKKIVKFGGSSLANAEQFQKVGEIIRSDESRQLRGKISYRSFRRSRVDIMRLSAD